MSSAASHYEITKDKGMPRRLRGTDAIPLRLYRSITLSEESIASVIDLLSVIYIELYRDFRCLAQPFSPPPQLIEQLQLA